MASKLNPDNLPFGEKERRELVQKLQADANAAKGRGELLSAMLYAADALMLDPHDRGLQSLVDSLTSATDDPLSLVPVATGSVHVATGAVRAGILMSQGKADEALDLLGACVAVAPDLAYLEWARQWLTPAVMQKLGFARLYDILDARMLRLALDVPVPPDANDPRLPNVRAAAAIFAAMRGQFPGEVALYSGETMIRRRLGDPNAALQIAREGVQRFAGDWTMQAVSATAFREAKQPDESLKHARLAMKIRPKDASPLHDAAWTLFDSGRPDEALALLDEVLTIDPEYRGANVSRSYMRFKAKGSEEDRRALIQMRERQWSNRQARHLADEIDPPVNYYNSLPGPGEATAAGAIHLTRELRHVLQCCGRGADIGFDLLSTTIESPSVALGFDVAIRALGGGSANLNVIPEPRTQTGASLRRPDHARVRRVLL